MVLKRLFSKVKEAARKVKERKEEEELLYGAGLNPRLVRIAKKRGYISEEDIKRVVRRRILRSKSSSSSRKKPKKSSRKKSSSSKSRSRRKRGSSKRTNTTIFGWW